jgi:hypothetical protein
MYQSQPAMMSLVKKCAGGQVIYQARFGDSWLCNVTNLNVSTDGFSVNLEPLRRVDTALWSKYTPCAPFEAAAPWGWLKASKHVITAEGYTRFCITVDPVIVDRVKDLISLPKHPHGEILRLLRNAQVEE